MKIFCLPGACTTQTIFKLHNTLRNPAAENKTFLSVLQQLIEMTQRTWCHLKQNTELPYSETIRVIFYNVTWQTENDTNHGYVYLFCRSPMPTSNLHVYSIITTRNRILIRTCNANQNYFKASMSLMTLNSMEMHWWNVMATPRDEHHFIKSFLSPSFVSGTYDVHVYTDLLTIAIQSQLMIFLHRFIHLLVLSYSFTYHVENRVSWTNVAYV